ncbi:ribulokinase [Brucella gallinifaecis]|uniref:ribulokinase n=1 Tax=Brucella gallinifaecis TaxID=215590 RepID=UPI002361EB10|nr:ribulokinase [Brucella gallinifaecis]
MSVVIGVDFGTLSVRATVVDSVKGILSNASSSYPLKRSPSDPDLATQSHDDHMNALVIAVREAIARADIDGESVEALACDTTGSSVVMVDKALKPLADYYLWCDHRAHTEASEITEAAHREGIEAIKWCGGVYSHEWGYAKVLHFLRHNPDKRDRFASAFEHCDMLAATLCGVTDVNKVVRSICAMGHKWMWGKAWGGLPPQDFLTRVDPLFDGINAKLAGEYKASDQIAGHLTRYWAEWLGLRAGIPVPVGALDAHWDAIGAGCRMGDVVNVVGTSTCIIALGPEDCGVVPGLCGLVPGSVHPNHMGVEAGLSATGDLFEAIARRAGSDVATLSKEIEKYGPGETGLLRLTWDNGDRTVLVRSDLGGVTLGWDINHTAADELHAAIEGTAFHTRIILERIRSGGIPIKRVINGGGIPQRNEMLNQIYADVLGCPVLVPDGAPTGLGSGIFAGLAAGAFSSIEEAQDSLCLPMRTIDPRPAATATYEKLFGIYQNLYFGFGEGREVNLAEVLPALKRMRRKV